MGVLLWLTSDTPEVALNPALSYVENFGRNLGATWYTGAARHHAASVLWKMR